MSKQQKIHLTDVRLARHIAAFAVCAGLMAVLCACDSLESLEQAVHPTVSSEDISPDEPSTFDNDAEEYDVTEDVLSMERPVKVNIHNLDEGEDWIAAIGDTDDITIVGSFVISDDTKAEIQAIIDSWTEGNRNCGFLLMDLETGAGLAYNIDTQFYSASGIKAAYVCALAYYYPDSIDKVGGYMKSTLVNSSNDAYEALFHSYPDTMVNDWRERAHLGKQQWGWMYTNYSVREWSQIWLVNWDFLSSGSDNAETVKGWLSDTLHSCFAKTLSQYETYSKAGWNGDETPGSNEGGIVITPAGSYVLVIMTNRYVTPDDTFGPLVEALDQAYQEYAPQKELDYTAAPDAAANEQALTAADNQDNGEEAAGQDTTAA